MRTEFSLSLLVFLALGACGKGKAPVESAVVPTTVVETEVKEETLDTVPAPPVAPTLGL